MKTKAYKIIAYKNDLIDKDKIQKAVIYGFDKAYPFFLEVVDYPLDKENLHKRMIWIGGQEKANIEEISKSGDWCYIQRM